MAELHSLLILSFAAGCCVVLLNADWLLQLRWRPAEAELQTTSSCSIVGRRDGGSQTAVDRCLCRETLFTLHPSGLICILRTSTLRFRKANEWRCSLTPPPAVHSASDGGLLASVDLLAYLNSGPVEDDLRLASSSFCLLQVSPDLSTAVAVTQSHAAVAVDLDHYFR